ncbi:MULTISPECIES: glycosyltransferase [Pacificimonas]|nr:MULTISPECIES: glycosyltransferase [Pacificimonas]
MPYEVRPRGLPSGRVAKLVSALRSEIGNVAALFRHAMVLSHSAAAFSLPTLLAAKLTGRPIILVIWDIYPESLGWASRHRLLSWCLSKLENAAYALSDLVLVNSEDYLQHVRRKGAGNVRVVPMWTVEEPRPALGQPRRPSDPLRLAWAGQINPLRDLPSTVRQVLDSCRGEVELHLFTSSDIPPALVQLAQAEGRLTLKERGFLPLEKLYSELGRLDFGLVSIDPRFDMPFFPSKTMSYLLAGIPVLFEGPRTPALDRLFDADGIGLRVDEVTEERLSALHQAFPERRRRYLERVETEVADFAANLPRLLNRH